MGKFTLTLNMSSIKVNKHWGNLEIEAYRSKNIDPLMPILQQEFPDWNSKRIKAYMELVNHENSEVSGVLAAKNEFGYYVGFLIYTYQKIDGDNFDYPLNINLSRTFDIFVIENINSCIPILQKQIFLALTDKAVDVAKTSNCDYLELPTLASESYQLVKNKYENQIQDPKTFRTYIKLSEPVEVRAEI